MVQTLIIHEILSFLTKKTQTNKQTNKQTKQKTKKERKRKKKQTNKLKTVFL